MMSWIQKGNGKAFGNGKAKTGAGGLLDSVTPGIWLKEGQKCVCLSCETSPYCLNGKLTLADVRFIHTYIFVRKMTTAIA